MFIADLHIHSKYSRATSGKLDLEHLYVWAQKKGLDLIGTGDFTYPQWFAELEEKLVPEGNGLYKLKDEISNIYKFGDKVRKVHNVVMFPDLEAAGEFGARLGRIGNVTSDGRPILGLDSRDLLEVALECSPETIFIPAHIWTPWFSALGSKSGFDSIEDCYRDLTGHIHAVETGLSSDPPMNWRVSALDRYFLVSNSDAHSPDRLGREATLFDCDLSYHEMLESMRAGSGVAGTLEFFPEEGKYHLDGHRKCNARLEPEETLAHDGLCPVCGKRVTVGVLNRVVQLADRAPGERGGRSRDFNSLFSLDQIIAECVGVASRNAKSVVKVYDQMLQTLGPELSILMELPLEDIGAGPGGTVKTAVERVRSGHVHLEGGFDGEFGVVRVFSPEEKKDLPGAKALFPVGSRHAIPLPASRSATTPAEAVDVDRIIPRTADLLDSHPEAAATLLKGLNHLLVDEFQDVDGDQYALVKALGSHAHDVLVIGDPNQSIYGFRGASPVFFERFAEHFSANRIKLEANYRSTPEIQRIGAMLLGLSRWDESLGEQAADIVLAPSPTDRAEAEFVAHTIERLVGGAAHFSMDSARVESHEDSEVSFGDIAVLTRTAFAADRVEEALARLGVPLSRPARPSDSFVEMVAVFDAAARFSANPADPLARKRLEKWVEDKKKGKSALSFTRLTGTLKRRFAGSGEPLEKLPELLYPAPLSDEQRAAFTGLRTALSDVTSVAGDLVFRLATVREDELARAGEE